VRRYLLVPRSGECISAAERGHRGSEQPDEGPPARSRQPPQTGDVRVLATAESRNADYADIRGTNVSVLPLPTTSSLT